MKKVFIIIVILFSKVSFAIDVDDAIKSTIENNPKVKIAFEKLEESKELIENAYNQKLPTITSTISGTYSNSDSSTATSLPSLSNTIGNGSPQYLWRENSQSLNL